MLSWKVQYDTTDHAYTPDWNTDSVSGDWDYIDQGTHIDGAPLQLSIDGNGVTLFTDHQIVFGDNGANTYLINPGNDTILDTDGQGSIVYNGVTLTGGTQISSNYWRGANNDYIVCGSGRDVVYSGGMSDTIDVAANDCAWQRVA